MRIAIVIALLAVLLLLATAEAKRCHYVNDPGYFPTVKRLRSHRATCASATLVMYSIQRFASQDGDLPNWASDERGRRYRCRYRFHKTRESGQYAHARCVRGSRVVSANLYP
jgi:hypothetical protein